MSDGTRYLLNAVCSIIAMISIFIGVITLISQGTHHFSQVNVFQCFLIGVIALNGIRGSRR